MDIRRETSTPQAKFFQIDACWIPATPGNPSLAEPEPIYTNGQESQSCQANWLESERFSLGNQLGRENWLELDGFSTGFSQESQAHGVVGCCGSTNSVDWEEELAAKSQLCGQNVELYNKFSMETASRMNNIPFADLMALANAATATSTSANATTHADGRSSYFGTSSINLALANHDLSLESNFQSNSNCAANIPLYSRSIPSRPSFDLNSPPRMITDAVLSRSLSSQFAPVTPDQAKKLEKNQVSDIPNLSSDETNQASNKQGNEVATRRVEVDELHHEKELSHAAVSTELQENHNLDKGGNQGTDLINTGQQKPRRRKHRPKVVIEGQRKRTQTPKPAGPKRKYVRKKVLNEPLGTPSMEVTSGTTDPKTVGQTAKSCRRSLNFDLESQERDESSSCRLPSNLDSESHAQNFCTRVQPTVHLGQVMEVRVDKTQMGIAYDLTRSLNQELEGYLSMPERQAPSPSTPSKTDLQHDTSVMAEAQNMSTRGKCRILFSDETHDKEVSTVQMVNTNAHHSTPRSPNDSNCSSSVYLTRGKQARGLKRDHSCTTGEAELCSLNAIGTYNSVEDYLAMFTVNEFNSSIPGVHFPATHKRKRTEKGHNSASSSPLSTFTAAQNSVRQAMAYALKDAHADPFTSETNCRYSAAQFNANSTPTKITEVSGAQLEQHTFKSMQALAQMESSKKKRSKGPTRVRDLASLIGIVEGMHLPTYPARGATSGIMQEFEISHQPPTCMEALVADTRATMATKKRTKKRNSLVGSVPPNLYNHQQFLAKSMGLPSGIIWKGMSSSDSLAEQLRYLDINVENNQVADQEHNALIPYNLRYIEQNALILYQRDGTVVPFEGSFNPVKRRRPRPKVDLDDETTRVWKLLLQDINSIGINGTDEEKAKWWEEERRVFRGRADSFIARMHLVQGDRRFSQWKGSVVDSVVGVFLTQNVSDHLSSSAFMSMAARFPLKSRNNYGPPHEERSALFKEPEVCALDPDDSIGWHENSTNQPACDQCSMTLRNVEYNEEKEVVDSNESFGSSTGGIGSKDNSKHQLSYLSKTSLSMHHESAVNRSATQITGMVAISVGDQGELDDVVASQNSVASSQNSVNSSIAQTAERIGSCTQSNSEAELIARSKPNSFGGSTSFVELLRMAGNTMLYGVNNQGSGNASCSKKTECNQSDGMACDLQEQNKDRSDGPKAPLGPMIPSSNYHSHLTPNSEVLEVECFDMLGEESRFSDIHKEKSEENCTSEQSGLSAESACQAPIQKIPTARSQEVSKASGKNNNSFNDLRAEVNEIFQSQGIVGNPKNSVKSQNQENKCKINFTGETLDVAASNSIVDNSRTTENKAIESNLNDQAYLLHKTLDGMHVETSKAKRGRTGKDKQPAVDWDSLRQQAETNGKRERTFNTMDSLDWEAVRCADVNEIAHTIRERGMNNMLAERIKAFLNRIVSEHGSIDLEWLRDVPPDKAKEYLLSIRGLGLKSVECVRLLTLHHLAFPVDTNVGRIAVRLGWVPLQPLPESLQLHLLELYPVLESIQKYLWPRLCKLDQRTLYELHYQMITFGKVFCTKSKPNCNACPMRGECRHFASAFASARLALPAPEERSIVSTTENKAADQGPRGFINQLQLPLPQANQQLELHSEVRSCEPIIEVPATPEPEPTQISESDIEDTFWEDPEEIPTIKLNIEEFTQNLQNYMQQNMELQEGEMSKALVALTPEAASIPMPKLKNVSRLRTEHQVYELPDSHPLLEGLDKREPDDPCSYLLAIWTPGETPESIQPPEGHCSSQDFGKLCDDKTCFSCNSIREVNSQTVRGTLLIPCRTAMRGSFPLNGTYFQVNEVFADHESSLNPIDVPRAWIWNLPRRTVYFGTSIPTIFKGLPTEGIQYCFWRGFVCVRGFDQKTRAPRPLMARLHFPASKLAGAKGKTGEN